MAKTQVNVYKANVKKNLILANNVRIAVNLRSKSTYIVHKLKCRNKRNGKLTE